MTTDNKKNLPTPKERTVVCEVDKAGSYLAETDCFLVAAEDISAYKKIKNVLRESPFCLEFESVTEDLCLPNGVLKIAIIAPSEKISEVLLKLDFSGKTVSAIPTDLDFSRLFAVKRAVFDSGGKSVAVSALPDKVIIISDLKKIMQKGSVADALCHAASLIYDRFEREILNIALGKSCDFKREDEIVKTLINARGGEEVKAVVVVQFLLSKYYFESGRVSDTAVVAAVLKAAGDGSGESERSFAIAKTAIKIFCAVIERGLYRNVIFADHERRVMLLSELFSASAGAFGEKYEPFDESELFLFFDRLNKSTAAKEVTKRALSEIAALNKVYLSVYGGKKRRADIDDKQTVYALALGSILSDGALKYLGDTGICDAFALF